MATLTRKIVEGDSRFNVINKDSLGFVTMLQLIPPTIADRDMVDNQLVDNSPKMAKFITKLNEYNEYFFSFDKKNRIDKNVGTEYSFSKGYCNTPSGSKISAIKFYPTSPLITPKHIIKAIDTLKSRKLTFDKVK